MNKYWSIEKIFVIITLFFGVLYMLILPPFQSVDEEAHFFRTFQIAQGEFVAQNINGKIGGLLPRSLLKVHAIYAPLVKDIDQKVCLKKVKHSFSIKTDVKNRKFIEFPNSALYSPICYFSQVGGVMLGSIISDRLIITYYLGRLGNLILYLLMVYFAIKIIPFYKLPLLCVALMPMSLSLASAYSSDVVVFGLNFLWIAILLKILVNEQKLSFKSIYIWILVLLAIFITLAKTYILLLPLVFLLPVSKFKNKKTYVFFIIIVCFVSILSFCGWTFLIKDLSLNMNNTIADPVSQVLFIKLHPFQYLKILLKTFLVKTPRLYITMIGVLGYQDTILDYLTYLIYPFLIYFGVNAENFNFCLKKWQKLVVGLTLLLGILITYTSLYVMYSPVENDIILGLNGKYFIPLVLAFLLLFKPIKSKYNYEIVKYAVIIAIVLILISSDVSLLHRFYDITPNLYYKV